jgi:hypothetical protein
VGNYHPKYVFPVLIWQIDETALPGHKLEWVLGPGGDECHANLRGLTDAQAEKSFKADQGDNKWSNFLLCSDKGFPSNVDEATVDGWIVAHA